MSKFNRILTLIQKAGGLRPPDTLNRAGGLAYQDTPRMALYRQVATGLWSGDGFYERADEWYQRFQENVAAAAAEDARFPFALAAYARDRRGLGLRSSAIALYVEAVALPAAKGTGFARQYAPRVLQRADEPAEAIAYFRAHHHGVVPHGMLRDIQDALRGFDEYQLAKYKDPGAVSMRDVLRLARPRPQGDDERALWGRVVRRTLETPYTWETELSACATDEARREKWNELIHSGKLGLFALVRNIRNIVKYGADLEEALSQITPERVAGSGILPFQWYKAHQAVAQAAGEAVAEPLQAALEASLADVPRLPGVTLVACDNSGSMATVSQTRGLSNAALANLMGAMALYCCDSGVAGTFGTTFALAATNPRHGLFYNQQQLAACGKLTGGATNAWTIFDHLIRQRVVVDRVILISDMQCYDSGARRAPGAYAGHALSTELEAYRQIAPDVVLYSINLTSQDNSCQLAPEQPVVELAGWSDSIFQFISTLEAGDSILERIQADY